MRDNVALSQIRSKLSPTSPSDSADAESNSEDDLGAFGWLRGIRDRAVMLELRHKDGRVVALGYSWLESIDFDPSQGITLRFAGQTVKISGRNLNVDARPQVQLLDGLCRHRIPWIREASSAALMTAQEHSTVIELIECGSPDFG